MNISKVLAISLIFLLPLQSVEALSDVHFIEHNEEFAYNPDTDPNNAVVDGAQIKHDVKHTGECFHSHFHSFVGYAISLTNLDARQNISLSSFVEQYHSIDTALPFRPPIAI